MRVWELAEELRVNTAVVLDLIRPHDAYVTSHLAVVPHQALDVIRADPPSPQADYFAQLEARRRARLPRWRRDAEDQRAAERQALRDRPRRRYRRRPGPRRITYEPPPEPDDDTFNPRDELRHEPTWSTSDICWYYGVRPATVRSWIARGHLVPAGKRGPSHIFNRIDIEHALDAIGARRKRTGHPVTRPTEDEEQHLQADLAVMAALATDTYRVAALLRTPIEALARLAASHPNATVTGDEAARLLGLTPATIRSWTHRGHLTPARPEPSKGGNGRRQVRYRLEDLHTAATRPRKRR